MTELTPLEQTIEWGWLDGDKECGWQEGETVISGDLALKICELIGLNPDTTGTIELHALSFGAPNWELRVGRKVKED